MKDGIKRYINNSGSVRFKINLQIHGVRIRKQDFYTKKEASIYLEKMRLLILTGSYEEFIESQRKERELRSDIKLSEFTRQVFSKKYSKDIRDSTYRRYRIGMDVNVLPLIGSKKLRSIGSKDFDILKEDMLAKGYKRSSVNHPISSLIFVLKKAKAQGLIDEVPKNKVKFVQAKKNVFLTDDELRRLFDALDTHAVGKRAWFKVYVHLQLNTFTRVGELLALNWDDVDFNNNTIAINKQYDQNSEKLTETKNSRIHTALPLSHDMMMMLKRYKIMCGFCPVIFPNNHFFSKGKRSKNKNSRDIKRMRRGGVGSLLKEFAVIAGIDPSRLSSHVLRKTAGDRLLRSGMTIQQVAYGLRIDPKTVLYTYSTVDKNVFEDKLSAFKILKSGNDTTMEDRSDESDMG